jgi:hypothetical protein
MNQHTKFRSPRKPTPDRATRIVVAIVWFLSLALCVTAWLAAIAWLKGSFWILN